MGHTYSSLITHLVFSTHERFPFMVQRERSAIHAFLGGILNHYGVKPITIGGVDDHVHLLVETRPRVSIADVVREVKCNSSPWIATRDLPYASKFHWQEGYAAFSVSYRDYKKVARYIERQEEHHRKVTFQDELRSMLQLAGIQFDERYLWD